MESSDSVLKQVEALFSAIDSLPESVRGEALKKIHLKLGFTDSAESKNDDGSKAKDDVSQNMDTAKPKAVGKGKRKAKATAQRATRISPAHSQIKIEVVDVNYKESVIVEGICIEPVEDGQDVEEAPAPGNVKSTRAGRKIREPRRFQDLVSGSPSRDGGNNEYVKAAVSDGEAEVQECGVPVLGSDDILDNGGERKSAVFLSDTDPYPVHIYSVPKDFNAKDFLQPIVESNCDGEIRRLKGMKTVYGCTVCTKKFHSKTQVVVHMRKHSGERPYRCTECDKSFSQLGGLSLHMKRHQGIFNFQCSLCDYKSLLKVDMVRHEARHRKEKNYFCDICGKSFATDPALRDHIENVHVRSSRFVCQVCGFVTHTAGNLKRHIDVKHANKECIECPVCGDVLKQRSSFITHMRTHTGERPHKCSVCGKAFKNQSQVAAHCRTHEEGRFPCTECTRCFKTKFHLKRHSLIHSGEKPFACHLCSYSCNVKGNINKHIKMVHGLQEYSNIIQSVASGTERRRAAHRYDPPELSASLRQKGAAMAEEFLSKMSLRKDEQLTVEVLQQDMESKKQMEKVKIVQDMLAKRKRRAAARVRRDETRVALGKPLKRRGATSGRFGLNRDGFGDTDDTTSDEDDNDEDAWGEDKIVGAYRKPAAQSSEQLRFCSVEEQQKMLEQNMQIALLTGMNEQERRLEADRDATVHLTVLDADGKDNLNSVTAEEEVETTAVLLPKNYLVVQQEGEEVVHSQILSPDECDKLEAGAVFIIRCDTEES